MEVKYSQNNVYRAIKSNADKNNRLFQVQVDITHRCNAHCNFCFQGESHISKEKELTIDEYSVLFKQLKECGVLFLAISGGEPFCRMDVLDILEMAKRMGFLVTFISNLQLATTRDVFRLSSIGINRITISVHSVNSSKYGKIFGVESKYFDEVISKIELLKAQKNSVGIAVTVTKDNIDELPLIKRFFIEKGFLERDIGFNMPLEGRSSVINLRPSLDEIERTFKDKSLRDNVLTELKGSNLCTAGRIFCVIDPYGNVAPCPFMDYTIGNIHKDDIRIIWMNSPYIRMIRDINQQWNFKKCNECNNNKTCHICMANNINETGHFNIPSDDYCNFRKKLSENPVNIPAWSKS